MKHAHTYTHTHAHTHTAARQVQRDLADIDAQLAVHSAEMDMMKTEGWQGHFNADIKVITAAIGRKTTKTTEGQRTHARAHARGRTHTHTHKRVEKVDCVSIFSK